MTRRTSVTFRRCCSKSWSSPTFSIRFVVAVGLLIARTHASPPPTPDPSRAPSVEPSAGPSPYPVPSIEPSAGPSPYPTVSAEPSPYPVPTIEPSAGPSPYPTESVEPSTYPVVVLIPFDTKKPASIPFPSKAPVFDDDDKFDDDKFGVDVGDDGGGANNPFDDPFGPPDNGGGGVDSGDDGGGENIGFDGPPDNGGGGVDGGDDGGGENIGFDGPPDNGGGGVDGGGEDGGGPNLGFDDGPPDNGGGGVGGGGGPNLGFDDGPPDNGGGGVGGGGGDGGGDENIGLLLPGPFDDDFGEGFDDDFATFDDFPTTLPSSSPSDQPSVSSQPSVSLFPSDIPSVSFEPSVSSAPSFVPSVSFEPSVSSAPSFVPSVSFEPSVSSAPSFVPTTSVEPSSTPTTSCGGTKLTVTGIACNPDDNEFDLLCAALQITQLDIVLDNSDEIFTVFAPTNQAFVNLLGDEVASQLQTLGVDAVRNLLLFHVVVGNSFFFNDLQCDTLLSMANGGETQTSCGLNLQKAQRGPDNDETNLPLIVAQDVNACNGIIHVIDEVMLPQAVSRSEPPPASTTATTENENESDSGEIVNIVGQLVYGP